MSIIMKMYNRIHIIALINLRGTIIKIIIMDTTMIMSTNMAQAAIMGTVTATIIPMKACQ